MSSSDPGPARRPPRGAGLGRAGGLRGRRGFWRLGRLLNQKFDQIPRQVGDLAVGDHLADAPEDVLAISPLHFLEFRSHEFLEQIDEEAGIQVGEPRRQGGIAATQTQVILVLEVVVIVEIILDLEVPQAQHLPDAMSGALVPLGPRLVQGVVQGVAKQPAALIPMAQGLLGLVLMKDEEGLGRPALEGGLGEIQAQLRQADQAQRLADGLEIPHLQRQPRRLAQTGLEGLPSRAGLEVLLLHLGAQQAAIGQEVVPIRRRQGEQAGLLEQGLRGKAQLFRLQGQGEAAGETPAEGGTRLAQGLPCPGCRGARP